MRETHFRPRPPIWTASSKKDYLGFPAIVQSALGYELFLAQIGEYPPSAQAFRGVGSGVFELRDEFLGDAYRTVYVVRFPEAVYVLHAFKKKSKRGISTPQSDVKLISRRLKAAETDYAMRTNEEH